MTDKATTEREFANEQLARAHDAESLLKEVHVLLNEAISSRAAAKVTQAWAWNRVITAVALIEQSRAVGDPQLWALVDMLFNDLAYIAPEDVGMRKTKVYDALIRARNLP